MTLPEGCSGELFALSVIGDTFAFQSDCSFDSSDACWRTSDSFCGGSLGT